MASESQRVKFLTQKRGGIKSQLTIMENYLEIYPDKPDLTLLRARFDRLKESFSLFDDIQAELETLRNNDEADEERFSMDDRYVTLVARVNDLLAAERLQEVGNAQGPCSTPTSQPSTHVKLPKAELPIFDGKLENWLSFKDRFMSMVGSQDSISSADKLNYLRCALSGEALEVIESFPTTDGNYAEAWELLVHNYANERAIVVRHVELILEAPETDGAIPATLRRLANHVQQHMRSLKSLGMPTDKWDMIVIPIILQKLDDTTRYEFEQSLNGDEMPTLADLLRFITDRARCLEGSKSSKKPKAAKVISTSKTQGRNYPTNHQKSVNTFVTAIPATRPPTTQTPTTQECGFCDDTTHSIHRCQQFLTASVPERLMAIRERAAEEQMHVFNGERSIRRPNADRARKDTCSTANFITENLAEKLQLPKTRCSIPVGALNNLTTTTRHRITATIRSMNSGLEKTLDFFTIPRISGPVPAQQVDRNSIRIPANITLADPEFHKPAPIEMLLGTGPTLSLFCVGQIPLSGPRDPELLLQKTLLGWVIGGNVQSPTNPVTPQKTCHIVQPEFELKRFWEIEECPTTIFLSQEEQKCEEHFRRNISRDPTGRYIVALPFNQKKERLGESHAAALKRFNFLQRRFEKNEDFKLQYTAVMDEYIQLGHMSEASIRPNETSCFLPHHAVMKETSLTTKLRVVFDGSAKSTTGVSLNDTLMTGPKIQDDLFSLILRFRLHRYVLTADIEKMYRQFMVREEDRRFQRILWTDSNGSVKPFELNTVTFGMSSAPFLATRCLQQLADDESSTFPNAARIIKRDMYVDDLLTGAETIEETIALRDEIIALLACGRLHLRQWASNSPKILRGLPQGYINTKLISENDSTLKTLGISWNSQDDTITYTVKSLPTNITTTKRMILSEIARIFDPLGLLGPIILTAKRIMQQIWQLKLDWDESVPHSIQTEWTTFREQLPSINNLEFHRKLLLPNSTDVQLHGFCDASEIGYGACIYLRSTNAEGQIQTRLLCAKSRVAPLKTVSLPRLELCGALVLATLFQTVRESISMDFNQITFWTDSMITLHWINTSPHLLKTFVANRVAEIQSHTEIKNWRHIPSRDNPADPLSRGLFPIELRRHSMWRNGPEWLSSNEKCWPETYLTEAPELPETRSKTCLITFSTPNELLRRYSSTQRLKRIIAYCLRFKKDNNNKGTPNVEELENAHRVMLRMLQEEEFSREVHDMRHGRRLSARSRLAPLDPFLDQDGLLRVGGRLKNAQVNFSYKHPIILPRSHHITQLLIDEEHKKNLHAGIQTTLYAVRQMYWPLDGRNQVRRVIRRCVKCFRLNPPNIDYVMGNLPPQRVTEAPPFENVGIDYCGPFFIKERKFRNRKQIKIYIAVFICLCTKAVHLEAVTDMTTEGFIAALRRFMARRGKCKSIHSDNGSNFIGANNELKELHELFKSDVFHQRIKDGLSKDKIEWHFIPPRSPHFGGLWEATVKRVKHHLRLVIGTELFTFEEFNTFITEIEAILNSRPLTPLSSDPNDLTALTPGHFLIGRPLNCLPDPNYNSLPSNRLSTWQHIQKVKRDFWTRWNKEYLNELNIRHKWTHGNHSIREGTMVILKEDHIPPMQWTLGRVIKIHPGSDGVIRTVTVRTTGNDYVRNVRKLAPLPIEDVNQSTSTTMQ